MVEGGAFCNVTPLLADDDHELSFKIELFRYARPNDRRSCSDEGRRKSRKDERIVWNLEPGLRRMIDDIQSDAYNFSRGRKLRQNYYRVQPALPPLMTPLPCL